MTNNFQKMTAFQKFSITAATLISLGYVIPTKAFAITKIPQPVNDSVTLTKTFTNANSVSLPGESFTLNGEQKVVKPLNVKDKTILLSQSTNVQQPINFVLLYPVLYTGTNGGGENEYSAPPGGATYNFSLTSEIPPGGKIINVWYVPQGSYGDLNQFSYIDARLAGERSFNLAVIGNPPPSYARVRIKIYVMWSY